MTDGIGNMIVSLRKSSGYEGDVLPAHNEEAHLRVDRDSFRALLQVLEDAGALQVTPHAAHRPEPHLEPHEAILHTYWLAGEAIIDGRTYRINETTAPPDVVTLLAEVRKNGALERP